MLRHFVRRNQKYQQILNIAHQMFICQFVYNGSWLPKLPSQDYFFAEGKGEYYAQAEYAEYRFKDGILLLARLLDKDLKGL